MNFHWFNEVIHGLGAKLILMNISEVVLRMVENEVVCTHIGCFHDRHTTLTLKSRCHSNSSKWNCSKKRFVITYIGILEIS